MTRPLASALWIVGLLLAGFLGGSVEAIGCSDNLRPGTTRELVCTSSGVSDFGGGRWLILAIAPAALLTLGMSLAPRLGRHPHLTGGVVLAALMVLSGFIITAASGNLS